MSFRPTIGIHHTGAFGTFPTFGCRNSIPSPKLSSYWLFRSPSGPFPLTCRVGMLLLSRLRGRGCSTSVPALKRVWGVLFCGFLTASIASP
jgi:hypothetical protein